MRWTRAGAGSLVAAAIAACVYGWTLSPSVGAGDSGELILAAHSLGVPHPPGYPLWLLLARCADLLPWGTAALRVNALSALLSALAVGLFYRLAARCGLNRAGRIAATLVFGGSTLVWDSAVQAEVYSLATAVFLALALAAIRARSKSTAGRRSDAVFFFLAGLALLAHQTLLFPALILAGWVLWRRPSRGRTAWALLWAAAGCSLVLLLPVRSGVHPGLDWGQDRNLSFLWDNLLRRNYGGLRQNAFRVDLVVDELSGMGGLLAASCGLIGASLAAIGLVTAGRARAALLPLTWAALAIPAALVGLLAFTPDAEHLAQIAPFLIPVAAAVALWAGACVGNGLRLAPRIARAPLAAVCAVALLVTLGLHYQISDRGGFRLPERYGRELLSGLPRGAVLVVDGDNETFLTAYVSRVEGFRPDVTLVNRRGYVFGDPYGLRGVPRPSWGAIQHRVDMERLAASRAPVYYATPPADLVQAGVRFENQGLVYRASLPVPGPPASGAPRTASAGVRDTRVWPKSSDLLPGGPERYDYVTRKLAISYSGARAQDLWEKGRYAEALPWFEDAARVGFDFPAARMNLAVAAAAAGKAEMTLSELLAALRLAPYDPEPSARLAVLFAVAGRYRDAAYYFERAYRIRPSSDLAGNAARAWSLAGEPKRAQYWEAKG
jgi:transmembrane protein TMEM260 (protein O-mannosyltransferase)